MARSDDEAVLQAYEAWDPDAEPLGEFLERLGLARQSLYNILKRHDVTPKSYRRHVSAGAAIDGEAGAALQELLRVAEWYLAGNADRQVLEGTVRRLRRRHPDV